MKADAQNKHNDGGMGYDIKTDQYQRDESKRKGQKYSCPNAKII